MVFIFFSCNTDLFAQTDTAKSKAPGYIIHLTTVNDNMLKGLLLQTTDSAVSMYPGKPKEWNANKQYKPVSFDYKNIKEIQLQKKNAGINGMLVGGGIGVLLFAASLLFNNNNSKASIAKYTFPVIPVGIMIGAVIGSRKWKKFNINSNAGLYHSFKNKVQ